jgi:alpha-beta hydrolase superfamily lysophospholipase
MQYLISIFLGLILLYAGMLLGFYLLQDHLIFKGTKLPVDHAFQFSNEFEERDYVTSYGIRLNTILFKTSNPKGVVFYNHGNSGDLQSWGQRADAFLSLGYDVFMYDYRGYGKSGGVIRKERQLHRDASFLFRIMKKAYQGKEIVVYGISLGTGMACKLASKFEVRLLILETPYFNFFDVIKFHYPFLPVKLISKYRFRNNFFLRKVNAPVYLVHGTHDETVAYDSSLRLKAKFPHVQLLSIDGGRHSDLDSYKAYHEGMKEALAL